MFTTTYRHSKPTQETQILSGHPNAKNLIYCWTFDEAGGTLLHDRSGYGCDVTLTNIVDADWVHERHGPALRFTAANLTSGVPARASDFIPKLFTVSAWVKMVSLPSAGNQMAIIDATHFGGPHAYALRVANIAGTGNVPKFRFVVWPGAVGAAAHSAQVVTDRFYHVVGVKTWSHLQVYIDGILRDSVALSGLAQNLSYTPAIGRRRDITGGGLYLNGIISDLRVNDYPFNAHNVIEAYENPYGIFVKNPMIIAP